MSTRPILFIHHANDMYGADIGLLHIIKSLDREKYFPIVILPSDMPTGMLSPELQRLGVEFHFARLGILRRKYLRPLTVVPLVLDVLRGALFVRATARRRGAVLVYVNTFVAVSGAMGGRLAGVPVLWHIREILALPRAIRWTLLKALRLCATLVICISRAVRDSLVDEEPALADKAIIVYNAVCVASNSGDGVPDIPLRTELRLPEETQLVGMVGRISHWKGQEVLVRAAALVLNHSPNVHFVAVGSYFADESHYLDTLKSLIQGLGLESRFHLVDYRSNVTDVYRALDIFVLPSVKPEPFGRVTVEAMTQGCAVIATNHGGTVELIEDGVTGMLVPPDEPKVLAAAIELLLRDPLLRNTMGQAASIFAKKNFGFEGHAAQMRKVIDGMVARHPAQAGNFTRKSSEYL